MHGFGGKVLPVGRRSVVGRKMHRDAPRTKLVCQRLGRKEMPSGAARGDQDRSHRLVHRRQIRLPSGSNWIGVTKRVCSARRRVSASSMPVERPMATSEEPP